MNFFKNTVYFLVNLSKKHSVLQEDMAAKRKSHPIKIASKEFLYPFHPLSPPASDTGDMYHQVTEEEEDGGGHMAKVPRLEQPPSLPYMDSIKLVNSLIPNRCVL